MNFVESHTWTALRRLMTLYDPDRRGWAIDVGTGLGDYYFEWFHNFGYPTLAVDPIPTLEVRTLCQNLGVPLWEGALGADDGEALLTSHGDIHSLYPALWGETHSERNVPVRTLPSLIEQWNITELTVLKLDIEGAEWAVIQTLQGLDPTLLPAYLSFEFGGVWARRMGVGPWAKEGFEHLLGSLALLREYGYETGMVIASGDNDTLTPFDFKRQNGYDDLFPLDINWGNIIAVLPFVPLADLRSHAEASLQFSPGG